MSWRIIQLGSEKCDQDQLILDLVGSCPVRIHGDHNGFDRFCKENIDSAFCLIFFNRPLWLSEIKKSCFEYLMIPTQKLYIGVNRYQIKGNDTLYKASDIISTPGQQILHWLNHCVKEMGFIVQQQGCFEKDQGKYFNFVQPLTWIYAEK